MDIALIQNHMRFIDHADEGIDAQEISTHAEVRRASDRHRMDCMASHRILSAYDFAQEKLASIPAEKMRPAPLITGDDLIAAGYAPGPRFKEILAVVEDGQLEGRLLSKEDALTFVASEFPLLNTRA
jgi:poly(A) polymerase